MTKMNTTLGITIDPVENAVETIAMLNIANYNNRENLKVDLPKLDSAFNEHLAALKNGDLNQIEAALYSQALILQDYFCRVIKMVAVTKSLDHAQMLGHLALKAQNQCRTTLSTLSEIKHPKRSTFIKQQNNAINQQVNNITQPDNFQKISIHENELLKDSQNEALDTGRTPAAIATNPKLEAVEKIDGRQDY